jgi:hypothetical protein
LFFTYSEKANWHLERKPKKRGEKAKKAEISNEKKTVIASFDRDYEHGFLSSHKKTYL